MSCALQLQKACTEAVLETLKVLGDRYSIQGVEVYPNELAEPDGMLPVLVYAAEALWCEEFGGRVRMALRRTETALLDVVTEFPPNGEFSVAWFQHALVRRLTRMQHHGGSLIALDELYRELHKATINGDCEVN